MNPSIMIIWTNQPIDSWHRLRKEGRLSKTAGAGDCAFLHAYEWMTQQMAQRLGRRPEKNALPLWGWYQFDSDRKKRPDLRQSGHLPKGTLGVRLEIEKDANEVLLSDFHLWHYVLMRSYLPRSLSDQERFDKDLEIMDVSKAKVSAVSSDCLDNRIRESWERIFDLDWEAPGVAWPRAEKAIQATFFELHVSEVRKIKRFRAR